MTEKKRRFSRIFSNMPVVLNVAGTSYAVPEVSNFSVGGCLLEMKNNLTVGAECTITIYIDGTIKGLRIDADGEIVRNDKKNVGIKFTKISPDTFFYFTNITNHSLPYL